jgi:hypothetical protein
MTEFIIEQLKSKNVISIEKCYEYVEFCLSHNVEKQCGITESHHILPKAKSMFPQYKNFNAYEWNCVNLTYEDHYIAHSILAEALNDRAVVYAWNRTRISVENDDVLISAKIYKELRERHIDLVKITSSKANKGKVDVIDDDGNIFKISKDDKRYISGELVSRHKGKKVSDETKNKISETLIGRKNGSPSEQTKEKISLANRGRIISDEWKQNISKGKKGKKLGPAKEFICPHCGQDGKSNAMKRWHFDNCKLKREKNE